LKKLVKDISVITKNGKEKHKISNFLKFFTGKLMILYFDRVFK